MKNDSLQASATAPGYPAAGATLLLAGYVYVAPAEAEEFVAEVRRTLPLAQANTGCLLFSFALEDVARGSVVVLEHWRSQQALDAHLARPEVIALFTKWSGKLRNEVRKFEVHSERAS